MQQIDAWTAEARAASILSGLQFTPERMKQSTRSLSGGWRMRVALAAALFVQVVTKKYILFDRVLCVCVCVYKPFAAAKMSVGNHLLDFA